MSKSLFVLAAFLFQSGPPGSELARNTNALAGLQQIILAVSTLDVGAKGGNAPNYGRLLLNELGGSTVETLVAGGVPAVRESGREEEGSVLLVEAQVLGEQINNGQAYLPFRVSLALIDRVTINKTGEELRAIVWKDEVPISFAAEEDLVEAVRSVVTGLSNRFAESYRVANGIR